MNATTALSHDDQIARVEMVREDVGAHIERIITYADDTYATSNWEIHLREGCVPGA